MTAMDQQPLVSIITPVYNGSEFLEELIQSVLQQDYSNIEHIIIDDGSTDDGATVSILKRYPHLRWRSRENKGQYSTLNEGIRAARGSILGIISADDMYVVPSAISSVVSYWQAHPEYDFVYGRTKNVNRDGVPVPVQPAITGPFPPWFMRWLLRHLGFISHCSLFVPKETVINEEIWFDSAFRHAGDWDWILRLSETGGTFGFLNQTLSLYREHPGQVSHKDREAAILEKRELCRRHGASFGLHRLIVRLIHGFRRKLVIGVWILRNEGIGDLVAVVRMKLRQPDSRLW